MTVMLRAARSRPFTLIIRCVCGNAGSPDAWAACRCPAVHCRPGPDGIVTALGPLVDEACAETVAAWLEVCMPADGEFRLVERLHAASAPQWAAHLD